MLRPGDFDALTFDCYGTLIDWEAGILAALRPWADRAKVRISDEGLLAAFARAESEAETEPPFRVYREVLRAAHARIARAIGAPPDADAAAAFAGSVGSWPAFPDTAEALRTLKTRHRLVIVSNVDAASFEGTRSRLGVDLDAVVTAEAVGAYKPDLRMFRRALEVLAAMGVRPDRVLHVAQSLYHDHVPAKSLGLATVRVDRRAGRAGGATPEARLEVRPDAVVPSLAALVEVLRGA